MKNLSKYILIYIVEIFIFKEIIYLFIYQPPPFDTLCSNLFSVSFFFYLSVPVITVQSLFMLIILIDTNRKLSRF